MSDLAYVEKGYYMNVYKGSLSEDLVDKYLLKASRQIDSLTYGRIRAKGFQRLTEFQAKAVIEAVCEHADFIHDNEDSLSSSLSGYSINGVSVKYDVPLDVDIVRGIHIKRDTYALLMQTGLCCKLI